MTFTSNKGQDNIWNNAGLVYWDMNVSPGFDKLKSGQQVGNSLASSLLAGVLLTEMAVSWWRHKMETFSASLACCAGISPVTGEFPSQRPVLLSIDVFCDLRLNKRLSKQWRGWWFETPSRPLWRHYNAVIPLQYLAQKHLWALTFKSQGIWCGISKVPFEILPIHWQMCIVLRYETLRAHFTNMV